MDHYVILIILSSIVLVSHMLNVVAKRIRIPSVLLLICLGVILKKISDACGFSEFKVEDYLAFLGAIGLILIVLEGVLDLKIAKNKIATIRLSFMAGLILLLFSTGSIALLFVWWLKADLRSALINAIPLGVISSAIVIPSIHHFNRDKRDFLTYEAIFSDILGIMLFNVVLMYGVLSWHTMLLQSFLTILGSLGVSYVLVQLIYRMKTKIKVFIILSLLVLVYAVGKMFHLSSLLLVFCFGLLLSNYAYISKLFRINKDHLFRTGQELDQFRHIVEETSFLIRTFFFIAFGFSIKLANVINVESLVIGIPVVMILLATRFLYLKYIAKTHLFPELFIAPKGLITILLFYSIPEGLLITRVSEGVLLVVIIATSLLMIIGVGSRYQAAIDKA